MMKIEVFCDGGARGNPGPAAIGFLIKKDGRTIYKHAEAIGGATNNVAEYTAVLKAMEWLKEKLPITHYPSPITFYLDSLLVVQQLSGRYKIKNLNLKKIALQIKDLERKLQARIIYHRIPRSANNLADGLVNLALDTSIN